MDEERLFREEAVPGNWRVLKSSRIPQNFDGWKLVGDFPPEVREKNQKRDQRPEPDPEIAQVASAGGEQQSEKERQAKE